MVHNPRLLADNIVIEVSRRRKAQGTFEPQGSTSNCRSKKPHVRDGDRVEKEIRAPAKSGQFERKKTQNKKCSVSKQPIPIDQKGTACGNHIQTTYPSNQPLPLEVLIRGHSSTTQADHANTGYATNSVPNTAPEACVGRIMPLSTERTTCTDTCGDTMDRVRDDEGGDPIKEHLRAFGGTPHQ
jgi:hypothetical protein